MVVLFIRAEQNDANSKAVIDRKMERGGIIEGLPYTASKDAKSFKRKVMASVTLKSIFPEVQLYKNVHKSEEDRQTLRKSTPSVRA